MGWDYLTMAAQKKRGNPEVHDETDWNSCFVDFFKTDSSLLCTLTISRPISLPWLEQNQDKLLLWLYMEVLTMLNPLVFSVSCMQPENNFSLYCNRLRGMISCKLSVTSCFSNTLRNCKKMIDATSVQSCYMDKSNKGSADLYLLAAKSIQCTQGY